MLSVAAEPLDIKLIRRAAHRDPQFNSGRNATRPAKS